MSRQGDAKSQALTAQAHIDLFVRPGESSSAQAEADTEAGSQPEAQTMERAMQPFPVEWCRQCIQLNSGSANNVL
jgi:hypothetical protein